MMNVENILKELIKFNTIKDKENEKIINYLEETLLKLGFKTEKRNRFLIMSNKNDTPLGFVGHTDTVEFTDEWKYEKFNLTKVENKLYGLGICDMKSSIAAIISAISQVNFKNTSKGIKLYFTYDEEIGFSGIKDILKYENQIPENIIIGEPTNNEIIVGSKGIMEYKISFKGMQAHSSTPDKGKNAITAAVSFISDLNEFYENELKKELDNKFEIPYTTMNIGKINGGRAINSVPDSCEIFVDFRTTDIKKEKKIIKKLKDLKKKYDCNIKELNRLSAFFNENDISNKTCNFITEASFLKNNRIILGAGPVTAHETNEYITIESLNKLVEQYKKIIEEYCIQ